MRPPYVKLFLPQTGIGDSPSSFFNSAILQGCIFWQQLNKSAKIYFYSCSHQLFCWIDFVGIYKCAFRHFVGFVPPFLYLGDEHDSWSTCLSQMANICYFVVFLYPAQSLLWVYPVWAHSQCGLEVL